MMTNQEMYRRLRTLGFSAEQALAEMDGAADDTYDGAIAARSARQTEPPQASVGTVVHTNGRRVVNVTMPPARRARGPMFEYFAKPMPKGKTVTVSAGNNTDVYKVLSKADRKGNPVAMSVPQIAEATGIPAHSVESSVYQLRTAKLVDKRAIAR